MTSEEKKAPQTSACTRFHNYLTVLGPEQKTSDLKEALDAFSGEVLDAYEEGPKMLILFKDLTGLVLTNDTSEVAIGVMLLSGEDVRALMLCTIREGSLSAEGALEAREGGKTSGYLSRKLLAYIEENWDDILVKESES